MRLVTVIVYLFVLLTLSLVFISFSSFTRFSFVFFLTCVASALCICIASVTVIVYILVLLTLSLVLISFSSYPHVSSFFFWRFFSPLSLSVLLLVTAIVYLLVLLPPSLVFLIIFIGLVSCLPFARRLFLLHIPALVFWKSFLSLSYSTHSVLLFSFLFSSLSSCSRSPWHLGESLMLKDSNPNLRRRQKSNYLRSCKPNLAFHP